MIRSLKLGKALLFPLIAIGLISILYWYNYEDLRLYILIQFYPVIAAPIILLFSRPSNSKTKYWILLSSYVLAKLVEYFDVEVHNNLSILSGHTLKHLVIALGLSIFLLALSKKPKQHT